MIAVLLLPNLLIFGVFVLIPLGLNFAYSLTGGTEILLAERPYVGGEHYTRLLDCEDYVRPLTCARTGSGPPPATPGFSSSSRSR
jgi:alpha-1,4-digalacturonate transport system permease protein